MKRIISFIVMAALLLSCVCFVSAVDGNTETVALVQDGNALYSIVYSQTWLNWDRDLRNQVLSRISSAVESATGTPLEITEAVEAIQDKEIYIGTTDKIVGTNQKQRQAEGMDFSFDEELFGEEGYLIRNCGNRYVIMGGSVHATENAIEVFISEFRKNNGKEDTLLVPAVFNRASSGFCETDTEVVLSIGGTDISEYTVVLSANASEETVKNALDLRRAVLDLTGTAIPLITDAEEFAGKKILLGHTNLYDDTGLADGEYMIRTENGDLIIAGGNAHSTSFALDRFLREELKIQNGKYEGNSVVSIPSDLSIREELPFAYFALSCPEYPELMKDNTAELLGTKEAICYSDASVADRLYDALNNSGPQHGDEVFLISNTTHYCECDQCNGKTDAFFATVNAVAKRFASAGVTVSTLAYKETRAPSDITMEKNVRVYFAEPELCCAHALNDGNCDFNQKTNADLVAWTKVCSDVYILDFTQSYFHYPSTFPSIRVIYPNISYYKELGINGVIMAWESKSAALEFGELRCELIRALLNDPQMSADAYTKLFDDTMAELYHSYAPKITEYLKKFEEASAEHFTVFSKPSEILPISKADGKTGADAYDLTLAKELGQIWEDVYYRHDPPEEPLTGDAMEQFNDAYIHSDYYKPLHARVQYSAWVDANIPICDRSAVYEAIIGSFTK